MAEAQVVAFLQKSLLPSQSKEAEQGLRQLESSAGFSLVLLELVADQQHDATLRLSSALYFKNFIKRNWTVGAPRPVHTPSLTCSQTASGEYKLPQNEVTAIKQNIITLMTQVPPNLQNQLGEAVSVIADSDFWDRWDTLVDVRFSLLLASSC
jgi:exportin-2 (importin alpha re-exporter)